jgi:acetolactate synthase-1/2/3 large subunit
MEEDPLRPRAPYWGFRTDYCIAGDLSSNLTQLATLLHDHKPSTDEAKRIATRTSRWHAHNATSQAVAAKERETARANQRITAPFLFDTLHNLLPDRSVIVDEIIAQVPPMIQHLFRDRDFTHIRGWAGALGTGLPIALGAKLARPDDVVVCVIGDGAFNYNPIPACLGLAQQYKVPVLVVICNNEGYVSQEWNLYKYFPSGYALRDNNPYGRVIEPTPDYALMAPAFGAHGECVTDRAQLEQALRRALTAVEAGHLALLDVRLAP